VNPKVNKAAAKAQVKAPAKVKTAVVAKATNNQAGNKPSTNSASKSGKSATTTAKAPAAKSALEKVKTAAVTLTPNAAANHSKAAAGDLKAAKSSAPASDSASALEPKNGTVAVTELKAKPESKAKSSARAKTLAIAAAEAESAAAIAAKLAAIKCPYTDDEIREWRSILLAKRSEVADDIIHLVKDAMEAEDGHTTPNHIAERGSDADLQDLSLGVAGEEKDVVWQIDRALRKIELNRPIPFGICEYQHTPIAKSRLQLIPWTALSIEGATHMEQNNLTLEDLLIED
jgi:RNA polymerase-binding transcription factor DksA